MKKQRKRKHGKMIRILLGLAITAVLAFAALVIYVCVAESAVPMAVSEAQPYDAIIVLGAQVKPDGTPSVQLQWRLDAAFEAWTKHPVPVVVCGARGADEPAPEALVMRQILTESGVPMSSVLTDPESFNTRENLENARRLLNGQAEKVLIVSSQYHVPRALALARDAGLRATGLGSPCKAEYWIKNHFREALAWVKYWGVKYLHLPL